MANTNTPVTLLSSMRQAAIALSDQGLSFVSHSASVKNIAYVVNDVHFFCEAEDVKEVAICENLVLIPQTKRWLRGLMNSKGILYSVTDLSLFAGYGRLIPESKGHLLLLNDAGSQCALLVNKVIGFRYFDGTAKMSDLENKQEKLDGLGPYIDEAYEVEGVDWFKLNVNKLLSSEQFREVQ